MLAGALFGLSAIGFRGGIMALQQGDFLIRALTGLALSLAARLHFRQSASGRQLCGIAVLLAGVAARRLAG